MVRRKPRNSGRRHRPTPAEVAAMHEISWADLRDRDVDETLGREDLPRELVLTAIVVRCLSEWRRERQSDRDREDSSRPSFDVDVETRQQVGIARTQVDQLRSGERWLTVAELLALLDHEVVPANLVAQVLGFS